MTETINRIEEALDQNWAVEAEDIRALVKAYKQKELAKIHWKQRCQLAEKYIEESPCDPDITESQIEAHKEWQDFVKDPYGIFNATIKDN